MIRLLLPLILLALLYYLSKATIKHARQLPPPQQRRFWRQIAISALLLAVLILTLTGKMHWLGALIAAAIPLLLRAINFIMQLQPFWKNISANTTLRLITAKPLSRP